MKKLLVLVATVVGVVAFGAAQASAASAPIVISYTKTCDATAGTCAGSAGVEGDLKMTVTGFRPTGKAAQLTFTEEITGGSLDFAAELSGHASPDGFIVLSGTVTKGPYAGAQVHQRSNLESAAGTTTTWAGELRIMPASA